MDEYYVEQTGDELDGYGVHFFKQQIEASDTGAKAHIHDALEILFIESGSYQILVNGHEFEGCPGDVFLFRANAIHSIYSGDTQVNQYYVLKVKSSMLMELSSEKNAVSYMLRFIVSDESGKIRWTGNDLEQGTLRTAFMQLVNALDGDCPCKDILLKICTGQVLYALLCDILRQEKMQKSSGFANDSAAAQVYKAIRHINRNPGTALDARQLSQMVNLSYSYFSRCFKKITGKSFKEYLNEVRINRAEHLLLTTNLSVTQVALECGYNNVSYFISVYKELKKKTPLSNRKAAGHIHGSQENGVHHA